MTTQHINFPAIREATIGGAQIQTVNARDLYVFLEVGKDFSTWIKDRIGQYDFAEGVDFVCSPILGSKGRGGHNRFDYHLTINMAKELAMVERNERGRQARQYFIECERQVKIGPAIDHTNSRFSTREARLWQKQLWEFAGHCGLDGNQRVLGVNQAVRKLMGVDVMALIGVTHLAAPQQEQLVTVTWFGQQIGRSARTVNVDLQELGLQRCFRDHAGRLVWEPTEKGVSVGATVMDTGKANTDGTPVRQLKWPTSVLEILRGKEGV